MAVFHPPVRPSFIPLLCFASSPPGNGNNSGKGAPRISLLA